MASPLQTSLPEELCCWIANLLGAKDACSLRVTCKRLYAAATESVFSFVRLYPNEKSLARYNKIRNCPHLNRLVKRVELHTIDPNAEEEEQGFDAELDDDVLDTFKTFADFKGLTGVTLCFSPHVSGSAGITLWPQNIEFRQSILQPFLDTLAQPSAAKINDVCFSNLQNLNDVHGKSLQSEAVLGVLSRLKTLRLYIATEEFALVDE